jgi:outer membrane receptor protein involved in Fe transport
MSALSRAGLRGCALAALVAALPAYAQTDLPDVVVHLPKEKPKPTRKPVAQHRAPVQTARRPAPVRPAPAPAAPQLSPAETARREVASETEKFDAERKHLLPKVGTNTYDVDQKAIEALPQGTETPVDKLLLQAPGVAQDSAASGLLHVRNEHANVQYRLNGILLPDGVSGFGDVLDSRFIGNLALITGALPAQYGLHTAGLVDITTREGITSGGDVSLYGGSRQTITPSFDYGGVVGKTTYFVTGRYFESGEGIENPTPSLNAIHDYTQQGKYFGYASTLLDETTRLVVMSGASVNLYQIPNNPGQTPFSPLPDGFPLIASSQLDERQFERNYYNIVALQKHMGEIDVQVSGFSRYSSVHFVPDPVGDIDYNGAATDVFRKSFLNGIQTDAAYSFNNANTVRAGFYVSGEQAVATTSATAVVINDDGSAGGLANIYDPHKVFGTLIGAYLQDEWRITKELTLNVGLRFDQMVELVNANQLSPRASLSWRPFDGTTMHVAYARYFTPPSLAVSIEPNLALYTAQNTALTPAVTQSSPVLPERSHYFDAGIDQVVLPGLTLGVDGYYKIARDLLDDGQFGQAYVLTAFNYDKAFNEGVEAKAVYQNGNFRAYGNLAWAVQMATDIVSNQSLFGADELAFIQTHYVFTDHAQTWTGSAGASYLWDGTRLSADMILGSGLRTGFANQDHLPAYTQFNVGAAHEFAPPEPWLGPTTLRFDIVNVLDTVYQIRNGSGIGVFAPQFGPRRGFFLGLSQKL